MCGGFLPVMGSGRHMDAFHAPILSTSVGVMDLLNGTD